MAIRLRGAPMGLPPGVYKVRLYKTQNRRGVNELEGELLIERRPKLQVRIVHNNLGVDIYRVVEGGETRAWSMSVLDYNRLGVKDALLSLGVEVLA